MLDYPLFIYDSVFKIEKPADAKSEVQSLEPDTRTHFIALWSTC